MFLLQVSLNCQLFEYDIFEGVKCKYAWKKHPVSRVSLLTWAYRSMAHATRNIWQTRNTGFMLFLPSDDDR